jgi:hypothetical protein
MYYGNDGQLIDARRREYLAVFIYRDEDLIRQLQRADTDDPNVKRAIRLANRRLDHNTRALAEM